MVVPCRLKNLGFSRTAFEWGLTLKEMNTKPHSASRPMFSKDKFLVVNKSPIIRDVPWGIHHDDFNIFK